MILKVVNTNPKVTFLTPKGKKTPKEVWLNSENGFRGMTKKSVIEHEKMLQTFGITKDMTDDEIAEHIKNMNVQKK
jgi:hypothetical protein